MISRLGAVVKLLAGRAGVDVGRAEQTFRICAQGLSQSAWPEVAWRFSRLTADGSPIEFSFSSATEWLRYTVEVGGPEMPESERIRAACGILNRLGYGGPPEDLIRTWQEMQVGRLLRWGCWLGIRQDAGGERAKLYVETPRGAAPSFLVMTGYEAGTGYVENYYRKKQMAVGELRALSGKAVQRLEQLGGMPIETALRFFAPGYSVREGQAAFFVRSDWIGGPARVRRQLYSHEVGNVLRSYRDFVGPLSGDRLPDHGVVTLAFDRESGAEIRAGLSGKALEELLAG